MFHKTRTNRIIWEAQVLQYLQTSIIPKILTTTHNQIQDIDYKTYKSTTNGSMKLLETFDRLIVKKLTEPLSDDILTGTQLSIDNRIRRSWVEKIVKIPK